MGFSALEVIREVKIRPGIYDRKSLQPPRWENRQKLWLEVAQSVTPQSEWENFSQDEKDTRIFEVTNKWKNLRDHFYREVKLIESGNSNKKRKYIYYDEMEFVRPYIGYKLSPKQKRQKVEHDASAEDYKVNDSDIDMESFLNLSDSENKLFVKKESLNQTCSSNGSAKKYKTKKTNLSTKESHADQQDEIKNFNLLQKKNGSKNPTFKISESDISFCLSLVQHLRELPGSRKISAKIDILRVIRKNIEAIEQNEEKSKNSSFHEIDDVGSDTEDEDYRQDPLRNKRKRKSLY